MRRALGLEGEQPRAQPGPPAIERTPVLNRPKRRFVADGDIPVVHGRLPRRDEAGVVAATAAPSRVEAAEAAARMEREAREKAERAVAEAHVLVHDQQTRLGHAQLAATEAQSALEVERATAETLRAALHEAEQRLAAARAETQAVEQKLQAVQAAAAAQRSGRLEPETLVPGMVRRRGRPRKVATTPPAGRQLGGAAAPGATGAAEPKPIRWWLKSNAKSKRR